MAAYNPKDPWSTGGRTGYTPPPVAMRVKPQKQFDMGSLLRPILVIMGLLWAFNYAWHNYYLTGR